MTIATRAANAAHEETAGLLRELRAQTPIWERKRANAFTDLIHLNTVESLLAAAMTLRPTDCWLELKGPREYLHIPTPAPNYWSASLDTWTEKRSVVGWGETEALALIAAIAQSKGL